ncbi:hypothetical protein A3Q56_04376 [Intoshia linei]|uniref:Uncharacterized protein n=1 Tax=Intoshia linei TaxID=1819745 RepID=A0A177B178_9BILA|nr:hypothetical protein A3Q56_04376 [Intoshia linei]
MLANDIPKTNNAIEDFHIILKKSFNCSYYSKGNMYNALKNAEEYIRQKYERTLLNQKLYVKKKYAIKEAELQRKRMNTAEK